MTNLEDTIVKPAQPIEVPRARICAYCNQPIERCNDRFDLYGFSKGDKEEKLIASGVKMVWGKGTGK